MLPLGLALATFLAAGDALLALLPAAPALGRPGRAGLAFLLGCGAVSLLLALASAVLPGGASRAAVLVPVLGLWLALGRPRALLLGARQIRPVDGAQELARDGWLALLGLVLVAEVATCAALALATEPSFDARFIFELKARLAYEQGGLRATHLTEPAWHFTHPDYPWLLPLAELWVHLVAGELRPDLLRAIPPCFFAALLAVFADRAAKLHGQRAGLAFAALLGANPVLVHECTTGQADGPLAALWLASVAFLDEWLEHRERGPLVLAASLAALGAWTKNEGLLDLAVLGAVVAARSALARTPRPLLDVLAVIAIVVVPWRAFLLAHGIGSSDFDRPSAALLIGHADRVSRAFRWAIREACQPDRWGLLWVLFGACAAVQVARRSWSAVALLGCAALPLATILASYAFSRWDPWTDHYRFSLLRILVQQAPVAWWLVTRTLAPVFDAPRPTTRG